MTFETFLLFMALHPERSAKAHAEIKSVIGVDRLPDLYDRPKIPYVDCIMKEVLR
jgi:hypothetical protein